MRHPLRRDYTAQFYRRNHILYWISMSMSVCTITLNFGITWLMQQMLDTVSRVQGALSLASLGMLTAGILLLIVLFKQIDYWTTPRFIQRAMVQYKDYAFGRLTKKNPAAFRRERVADYLSGFSNDLHTVETDYLRAQFEIVVNLITLAGATLMMLWYSPVMAVIAVGFCALPVVAAIFTGNKLEEAEKLVSSKNAGFLAALKDALSGFPVMKSFQAETEIARIVGQGSRQAEEAKCRRNKLHTLLDMIGAVAAVIAQLGTFLAGCALSLSNDAITPGKLVAFLDLTGLFIMGVRALPVLLAKRGAALGLIDKLAATLEEHTEDHGLALDGPLHQEIRLSHLSFAYDPEKPVLQDISCSFEMGKSYAIVGASGSGKSTLLTLLAGCDRYEGSIRFDAQELRDISSKSLCDAISVIQQNVFVFNASIRDNITMFKEFPNAQVDEAIRLSGLPALIAEKGEHYLCGENGCNLSGGEKQRISIARSLLRNAQILLADEATAALDAETAYQVSDAILNLTGMTRIVVTHALDQALLRRYDAILAMKSGRIVESGSFDELMKRKGYFYSLYTVSQ